MWIMLIINNAYGRYQTYLKSVTLIQLLDGRYPMADPNLSDPNDLTGAAFILYLSNLLILDPFRFNPKFTWPWRQIRYDTVKALSPSIPTACITRRTTLHKIHREKVPYLDRCRSMDAHHLCTWNWMCSFSHLAY